MKFTFPERIKIILKKEKLSYEKLGKAAGVSATQIGHYINDGDKPGIDVLENIEKELHISSDWLLTGEGPYKREFLENPEKYLPEQAISVPEPIIPEK